MKQLADQLPRLSAKFDEYRSGASAPGIQECVFRLQISHDFAFQRAIGVFFLAKVAFVEPLGKIRHGCCQATGVDCWFAGQPWGFDSLAAIAAAEFS